MSLLTKLTPTLLGILLLGASCSPASPVSGSPQDNPEILPNLSPSPLVSASPSVLPGPTSESPLPSVIQTPEPTPRSTAEPTAAPTPEAPPASPPFFEVQSVIQNNCTRCHSGSFPAGGVSLESPENIQAKAQRIKARAVDQNSMPPGGGLSNEARATLDLWVQNGAKIE